MSSKYQNGITLIATVITIVVLLILASISLKLILGDNGIINKTKKATEEYSSAKENDELEMNKINKDISSNISRLPSDYKEVEYLKGLGDAYIDTGIKASNDFCWEVEAAFLYSGTTLSYFGMGTADNSSNRIEFGGAVNLGKKFFRDYATVINDVTNYDLDEEKHKFVYYGDGNFAIDEEQQYTNVQSKTLNPTSTLYLFKINKRLNNCVPTIVYYSKIYRNDTVIQHLVPCYRDNDNKPGMYDLVTGQFYTNESTTGKDFEMGPDI